MVDAEIGGHADPQQAGRCALHRCHKRVRLARVVQHPAGAVIIGQPDFGGRNPAGRAVQQAGTKPGLERGDVF